MDSRVDEIIAKMKLSSVHPSKVISNTDQLLEAYPMLKFVPHTKDPEYIWHDCEKQVTPDGAKNSLNYNEEDVYPLVQQELEHLVKVHKIILQILTVEKASRNKRLFLDIIEKIFDVKLTTGGGTPPNVRRVILMYEKEGNVKPSTKKAPATAATAKTVKRGRALAAVTAPVVAEFRVQANVQEEEEEDRPILGGWDDLDVNQLSDRDIDDAIEADAAQYLIIPAQPSLPIKKQKTLEYTITTVQPAALEIEGPLAEWLTKKDISLEQHVLDNFEIELLEEYEIPVHSPTTNTVRVM